MQGLCLIAKDTEQGVTITLFKSINDFLPFKFVYKTVNNMYMSVTIMYRNKSNFVNESYLFTQISTAAKAYTINGARTVYVYPSLNLAKFLFFNALI